MDEIQTLLDLDLSTVALGIVGILVVLVLILSKLDFLKKFFGIKTKSDIERELLERTSRGLSELQQQHMNDMKEFRDKQNENVKQSIEHDERIRNDLIVFISEMRDAIESLTNQMNQYLDEEKKKLNE